MARPGGAPGPGTVIVGCGSWLGGDDAIGLLCLEEIERHGPPRGVRLAAAPGGGFAVWEAVRGARRAAIIDGMLGAGEPGEVRAFDLGELVGWWPPRGVDERAGAKGGAGGAGGAGSGDEGARFGVTSHDISPLDGLRLGFAVEPGLFPAEVTVFGVQMARWGRGIQGLSPEVAAALPRLVAAVRQWASEGPS
jgi:Ni,Fe-hydrogenase maturation factor